MYLPHKILLNDEVFWLTAQRCIFWEKEKTLIVADLHLGKTGHFRKSGIAVPGKVYKEDLQVLLHQILYFKTDRLIILGDMTHSVHNLELELFTRWRKDFTLLQIELVKGNHDILNSRWYEEAEIITYDDHLLRGGYCFRHDKPARIQKDGSLYTFYGHIHPAIQLKGGGRQKLSFPCFYFTQDYCIMPAFSKFSGSYSIKPSKEDSVFAIVKNEIVKVQ